MVNPVKRVVVAARFTIVCLAGPSAGAQEDGEQPARKLELVEPLDALGIDVKGMRVPLTESLNDPGTQVLTF